MSLVKSNPNSLHSFELVFSITLNLNGVEHRDKSSFEEPYYVLQGNPIEITKDNFIISKEKWSGKPCKETIQVIF